MEDGTGGITIKEFVGWKSKIDSFLVDQNSQHKKTKGVNKNVYWKNNSQWIQRCFVESKFFEAFNE